MVYVTGDTHGDIEDFNRRDIKRLNAGDTLIICGDFGFIWNGDKQERKHLEKLSKLKFNILFVDGTHENLDMLKEYPVEDLYGGKVRKIFDNIYHLMRGQIFDIEGKTFFTFGGGKSLDKYERVDIGMWWEEEMPTINEMSQGVDLLNKTCRKIDYIITHEPPNNIVPFRNLNTDINMLRAFFESVSQNTDYKRWFFGSVHKDKEIGTKYRSVFEDIVEV